MVPGAPPVLTGRESKELSQQAEEYPTDRRGRVLKYFSKFFMVIGLYNSSIHPGEAECLQGQGQQLYHVCASLLS